MARKRVRIQGAVAKVFITATVLIAVVNLFVPSKGFSEEENRNLTQKPKLTWSSVISGAYMEKYEEYQADQFAGRNVLRKLKVTIDSLGGKKEENGVYRGKDHQLIQNITVPDSENLETNLEAISQFARKHKEIPMTMMLVPDVATIYPEKLPGLVTVADQELMIKNVQKNLGDSVQWVDIISAFEKNKDEKLYYETDHHWTSLGAYYAFQAGAEKLKVDTGTLADFVKYPITTEFNGALSSQSGYESGTKEQIDIYVPKDDTLDVVVNYVEEQKKTTSLYDSSKLNEKDKYTVFFGGNYSLIDIKTTSNSKEKLLLFKDSFANSFVQFLIPYYREIVVVDPRYFSGDIEDVVETYKVTDMLMLYHGNTFFEDKNISGVLTGGKSN